MKKKNVRLAFWGILVVLLVNFLLLAIPLFRIPLLPGFDSPFYLYMSSQILEKTNFWVTVFAPRFVDRSVTFIVPAMMARILGLTPVLALKIFLILIGLLQTWGIYLLARKLYGIRVGLASAFVSVFILGYLRIFHDLYANFFAISLIPFALIFLLKGFEESRIKRFPAWILGAGILTGTLFYVHNLTATIIFFGVILPWLLIQAIFFRKNTRLIGFYFLISVVLGLPSLKAQIIYLSPIGLQMVSNQTDSFPFARKYFLEFIQWPFILVGGVGILWLCYNLFSKKNPNTLIPLLWCLAFLGVSQQQAVGLNLVPERFVASFTQPFSLAAGIGIFVISDWLTSFLKKKNILKKFANLIFIFVLIAIIGLAAPRSLQYVIFGIKPTISEKELLVLQKIGSLIQKDDLVIFSNLHHYWFQAILPSLNIEPGEFYLMCGDEKVASRLQTRSINMSYVLSKKWDVKTSAEFLQQYAKEKNFKNVFVYLNLEDKCLEVKKFEENPRYFQKVYQDQNGFRLYRLFSV